MISNFKNPTFAKGFKLLLGVFSESYKVIVLSTFTGLIIGFLYSTTLTPLFSVKAVIVPNDITSSQESSGAASDLIGAILGSRQSFNFEGSKLDSFVEIMYSYPTAKILWDQGYDKIFFASSFNEDEGKYLMGEFSFAEKVNAWILGYDINAANREIGPSNLKPIIRNNIKAILPRNLESGDIVMQTSDPSMAVKFITDALLAADQSLKEEKISYANSQINFLNNKLLTVSDIDIRNVLNDSLKKQYMEIAFASSDLPYAIKIIEPPVISSSIVSPNLEFVYNLFTLLGFLFPVIILFVRKLFNQNSS
jgi:hypothetical protein